MTELVRLSINITSGPETCVISSPVFRQGSGKEVLEKGLSCAILILLVMSLFCQVGVCNNWVQNRILELFGLKEVMGKKVPCF